MRGRKSYFLLSLRNPFARVKGLSHYDLSCKTLVHVRVKIIIFPSLIENPCARIERSTFPSLTHNYPMRVKRLSHFFLSRRTFMWLGENLHLYFNLSLRTLLWGWKALYFDLRVQNPFVRVKRLLYFDVSRRTLLWGWKAYMLILYTVSALDWNIAIEFYLRMRW